MPGARDSSDCGRAPPAEPLADAALIELGCRAYAGLRSVVVAVSGGADSMALMLLTARWQVVASPQAVVHVVTVDHGLRPESAAEAQWVARAAAALGLTHHVLAWDGEKPATGRQEAAREARYRLLTGLVDDLGLPRPAGVAVAHHRDDQAETVLMRLARGSGLDGLAGMRPVRPLALPETLLVRPFLEVGKGALEATLTARGIAWLEDPSNANIDFERARLRRAMNAAGGLGLTASTIATSARRLGRAKAALDQMTDHLIMQAVATNAGAYARVDAAAFDAAPAELRLRLVQRIVARFGGAGAPSRMTRLEGLVERLSAGGDMTATLGGCQLKRVPGSILAFREAGRRGLPEIELAPGTAATWDGRFVVSAGPHWPDPITVKAVSPAVLNSAVGKSGSKLNETLPNRGLSRRTALTLPSFWAGERLLAVPHLGRVADPSDADAGTFLRAAFIPI